MNWNYTPYDDLGWHNEDEEGEAWAVEATAERITAGVTEVMDVVRIAGDSSDYFAWQVRRPSRGSNIIAGSKQCFSDIDSAIKDAETWTNAN